MTARIGSAITAKVVGRLTGPTGVTSGLAALTLGDPSAPGPLQDAQVRPQNVAADLAERGDLMQYPFINVYCENVANQLEEKFRTFSGKVQMAIDLRHSQDRLDGLQDRLELYCDAVLQVLHASRGDWGDGMFYCGAYQVMFGAVKRGGKNYIQGAKITFEIGVSKS